MTDETERDEAPKYRIRLWMLVPVIAAGVFLGLFAYRMFETEWARQEGRNLERDLPSALIGKPAPQFELPPLYAGEPGLSTADMKVPGVKLVNVWASWCVPCRAEHPMIERLAEMGLTVHGLNYKDSEEGAKKFLAELGNPFTLIGADRSGRVGIEWGVYGVPETFVIDGEGRIIYKHIGPIQGSDIEKKILPAVEKARGG